ncbi:MAG: CYTH domain-containing protein [Trueperaceae bacterium]
MPLERERKFSSPEGHVPSRAELALSLDDTDFSVDAGRVARQRDIYFDDARGSLRAAGWALRLRQVAGRTIATAKSAGRVVGALHEREEIEEEVHIAAAEVTAANVAPTWPATILRALEAWVDPTSVVPVVLLDTARIAFTLQKEAGAVVELAFDEVRCRLPAGATRPQHGDPSTHDHAPDHASTDTSVGDGRAFDPEALFHEVEIEAKAGATDDDLHVIDEALAAILTLTPSSVNKLERALALLGPFRPDPRANGG